MKSITTKVAAISANGKHVPDAIEASRREEVAQFEALAVTQEEAAAESRFAARYLAPLASVADALKPQPPLDYIVEGIGEAGGVAVFVGQPGSKKTYMLMHCGVSVAMGINWLGRATKQCRVLWIDEDSGHRRIMRRLGAIARGLDAPGNTPFETLSLAGINILNAVDARNFEDLIERRGAGLVIIDTLADIVGDAKIVSPDDMQPVLRELRRIAESTNALIVVIHHTNKAGEYLGAVNIKGKVDAMITVESKTESPLVAFKFEKDRDGGGGEFAAAVNFYPDQVVIGEAEIEGISKAKRISDMGGAGRHVYDYLQEHATGTIDDMTDELNKRSAVEKAVKRLRDEGIVKRVNEGGRGRDAGLYGIVSDTQAKGRGA